MDNLLIAVRAVAPFIMLIGTGAASRAVGFVTRETLRDVDSFAFKLFLPVLIFNNIYGSDLKQVFNLRLVLIAAAFVLIIMLSGMAIVPQLVPDRRKCSSIVQALFRGNFVLYGMVLAKSLYGDSGTAVVSVISATLIPFFNVLAVIEMEYYRGNGANPLRLLKGIVTNPLIIASAAGILVMLLGIHIPDAVAGVLDDLGGVATPLCLISLGGALSAKGLRENMKPMLLTTVVRMLLIPAIALPICVLCGFRGHELASLMVVFGGPVAVSSYQMAQGMDADAELSGLLVASTTIASLFTLFVQVFILNGLGLL